MDTGQEADLGHYYRQDRNFQRLDWTSKYKQHPYFGYAHPRFQTYEEKRVQVSEKPYVIGILGGSVAQSFGTYILKAPGFVNELKRQLPDLASENIAIWNLSAGGYKQPQQYFIASYFLVSRMFL